MWSYKEEMTDDRFRSLHDKIFLENVVVLSHFFYRVVYIFDRQGWCFKIIQKLC